MKVINAIAYFILVVLFGCVLLAFYCLIPVKVFSVEKNSVILTPIVKVGGTVKYMTTICKYKDLPTEIAKTAVNGFLIQYTPYTSNIGVGCVSKETSNEIPLSAQPGKYFIKIICKTKINPLQENVFEYRTEEFEVIK